MMTDKKAIRSSGKSKLCDHSFIRKKGYLVAALTD
jgi:hypothetical protein